MRRATTTNDVESCVTTTTCEVVYRASVPRSAPAQRRHEPIHSFYTTKSPLTKRAEARVVNNAKLLTLHNSSMLPNDSVSMSVGHLDHVLIVYSLTEHVTWKSPGPGDFHVTCKREFFL